jgi:hypothetical protein
VTHRKLGAGGMITYRDSGVADGPHAAVVHHRLKDDPGSFGRAVRVQWRGIFVHVGPWPIAAV